MRLQDNERLVEYVNLFVSVLICFPEVGKICYHRDSGVLCFTFMLKEIAGVPDRKKRLEKIRTGVEKYLHLERKKSFDFQMISKEVGDYLIVEIRRDMDTVTREEITFLIELFRLQFMDNIMVEKMDSAFEDEYQWYYEDGEHQRLNDRRITMDEKSVGNQIVVCREAGKVLVFSN
ncbi:MAG: hypothetical protein ACI3W6_04795 [Clostridia bacterium]